MFRVAFVLLMCEAVALGGPAGQNDSVPPAVEAESIHIMNGPWRVSFYPDGRVFALYGSRELGGYLPKGTVNFDALLVAVRKLKGKPGNGCTTEVVVWRKNETSTTSFTVSDDTLFRYLVASFEAKWQDRDERPVGERFRGLLKMYPIYPDENKC